MVKKGRISGQILLNLRGFKCNLSLFLLLAVL